MIASSFFLFCLPYLVQATVNCNGIIELGCFEDIDCAQATTTGKCEGGVMATLVMGCCRPLATTTPASVITTHSSCVDKINPMTGLPDCEKNARLCDVAAYYEVMSEQCPRTCGRCGGTGGITSTNSTACADQVNPMTRRSDCQERRVYCKHTAYAPLMKVQCPATCGFCT